MFDIKVSSFRTFAAPPVDITLLQWLEHTMNADYTYADQVLQYRETNNQHIKKGLPCVSVGALCKGGHSEEDVISRTGFLALDIDADDNKHITHPAALRNQLSNIPFIAFAGLSASGNGVWALVKVKDPKQQKKHFQQLQADFKHIGITLDSTKGNNPSDLRFYSLDPDAYMADDYSVYDRLPKEKTHCKKFTVSKNTCNRFKSNGTDTRAKVEKLISKINTDITAGYENWRNLCFALESEFGESGRSYFHDISKFHPNYDKKECDRKYTYCLEHSGSGRGIGTFFRVCRQHGITLKDNLNGSTAKFERKKDENPAPHGYNPYTGEVFDQRGYPSDWDSVTLN